jgi:hypothetical protein
MIFVELLLKRNICFQKAKQFNCLTGIEYFLITLDHSGNLNINTSEALKGKVKPIAAVFDSKPFRDTGTQCKLTPPSQISLWASSDIDRHLSDKIISGVLKPMTQSHSDLSLSASAIETCATSVNVKDIQINNISINGAIIKGEISTKRKLSAKKRRHYSAKNKENQPQE